MKIRKYFKVNNGENMSYHFLWNVANARLTQKIIAPNMWGEKTRKSTILVSYVKKFERRKENKRSLKGNEILLKEVKRK